MRTSTFLKVEFVLSLLNWMKKSKGKIIYLCDYLYSIPLWFPSPPLTLDIFLKHIFYLNQKFMEYVKFT